MKYSIERTVEARDTDRSGFATNAFILKCLEDVSTAHSESLGYGFEDMRNIGLTWMLVDWRVEVLRRPKIGERLTLTTWSRGTVARAFALRDYEIASDGEILVKGSSRWLLYDVNALKIARISDEMIERYGHDKDVWAFPDGGFEKLNALSSYDDCVPYEIKPSDIDGNGHVHNLVYLDIAISAISRMDTDRFSIAYKKEIRPDDKPICLVKQTEDGYFFEIKNAETGVTNAFIKMS